MAEYSINAGDKAPDFELPIWPEGDLRLSTLRGKWVVLYFYPRDKTPGCTIESCEFRDASNDLESAGAVIVGVSRDAISSHQRFAEKFSLPFRLVSDPEEAACSAFDVMQMKNMYGKKVRGVERSTFLIDPNGVITHVWRKVKVKGHVADVLEVLKESKN
jgi:peroxiredoxin Q/BCP